MNETITITENKLLEQLKKFDNKDVTISFNSYVAERITLHSIRVKKKDFTIIMRSKTTNELFCLDLCDLSNIKLKDNVLYLYSETVGRITIKIYNKRYVRSDKFEKNYI